MSQQTGENEQAIARILDMIRMISIVILLLHFYSFLYPAFVEWRLTSRIGDSILSNIRRSVLLDPPVKSKVVSLFLLGVSLLGARGKKDPVLTPGDGLRRIGAGLLLFFISIILILLDFPQTHIAVLYMVCTSVGYLLVLDGGNKISRTLFRKLPPDIFNRRSETFPQQEERIENEYSIHFPATYRLRDETRSSWINIIDPFRGTLILGSPGSGKTYFIIQSLIKQQIQKGFAMLLYDFKYDDLSVIAYNYFLRNKHKYPGSPAFYNIHLEDLDRSHRCNPLHPSTLRNIADATESARTILLGLNMEWVGKQGDFFVESPINFLTTLIWFLRNHREGQFCTLPHIIELAQVPYKDLFSILRVDPEVQALITPFVNAYLHGAMEQLEGQIASANISLSRLSMPSLYYVMTADDFTLDLNNPDYPKILTLGNSPQMTDTYGPVLSVYINTINRLNNRKDRHLFAEVLDEFSTIIAHGINKTMATSRSNRMATTLAVQDTSQLRLAYGKEFAEVIINICGNVIAGHVTGETARLLSDRFGKTMQERESLSISATDTNITQSHHLEEVIPVSRIATLSSGEFVGIVADSPDQLIEQKIFCSRITQDHRALRKEEAGYKPLPIKRQVTSEMLRENYMRVKGEVAELVAAELERMRQSPGLGQLIILKSPG